MISPPAQFLESPALRADLVMVRRVARDGTISFLVQDPETHDVFEMGEEEYFLSQQLDGQCALEEIRERFEEQFGGPLAASALHDFIYQLYRHGFLVGATTTLHTKHAEAADEIPVLKWSLFRTDILLGWAARRLWWCFSMPFLLVSAGLFTLGLVIFMRNMAGYFEQMEMVWRPSGWLTLFIVGMGVVHIPHQLLHGIVCKHFRGQVPEAGLRILYYVVPTLYVNLEYAKWLWAPSKIYWTYFAGLYWQLVTWALGIVGWSLATPEGLPQQIWLAISSAAFWGFLHNSNPVIKRDLYVLLVLRLKMPGLRERAYAYIRSRLLLQPASEPLSRRGRRWFWTYGVLAFLFACGHASLILYAMGSTLVDLFQGPGALLAVIGVIIVLPRWTTAWLRRPVRRIMRLLLALEARTSVKVIVWIALAIILSVVLLLPYPYETGGPFTILSAVQTEVHCEIDGGRIDQVFVVEGAFVSISQPLAQIDRREYETNVQTTQAQLETTEASLRLLRKQLALLDKPPNIEQIQSLEAEVRRLQAQLADYQKRLDLTTLRAPVTGRVTTPLVEQKVGQYLKKGDLFATVEQVQALQVEIQVPEGDVPQVRVGERVKIVPWAYPHETFLGSVKEIAPIAAMPSYSKVISVRVIAEIPNTDLRLKPQLTGFAKIRTERMPVWLVVSRLLVRWLFVQVWYWLP